MTASTSGNAGTAGTARTTAQTLALVIGVVYLLVGIAGFFVTQQITGNTDQNLIIFEVNGLHNIVHILIGIAGIALSRTVSGARTYGLALLVVYGLVFIYGLVTGDDESILSLNLNDDILHLLSALAGGVIFALSKDTATARTT